MSNILECKDHYLFNSDKSTARYFCFIDNNEFGKFYKSSLVDNVPAQHHSVKH